jgi:hypothetical protein
MNFSNAEKMHASVLSLNDLLEEVEWFIARFLVLAGSDWLYAQSALELRA